MMSITVKEGIVSCRKPIVAVAILTFLGTGCTAEAQPGNGTEEERSAAAVPLVEAAAEVVEFEIPREDAFPHDPAVGSDGIVWYTDQRNSFIGRLDPATGEIRDYPTPTPSSGPHGITVAPDGGVWYTAQRTGRLGRLDPSTGEITEYPLPAGGGDPHTLIWHDVSVWFTVQGGNRIGRLDPATGEAGLWAPPTPDASPYGIVPAPDGTLWVALFGTNKLLHVEPGSGTGEPVLTEVELENAESRPRRLAVDDRGRVWYTDYPRHKIGMYEPVTGLQRERDTASSPSQPYGIAIGPDGRIWYNEASSGLMVGFGPATGEQVTVTIPTSGAIVRHMVLDPERERLWLALSGTGRIGLIDLADSE